ncbi:energy transducer TonB [Lysobacter xanthus]
MHTIHAPRVAPLDPARIASISGAIAVNGLLFLLLVAPMSAPVLKLMRDNGPIVTYIPVEHTPPPPPPKDPPIRVRIEHTTTPRPVPTPTIARPDPQPVLDTDPEPGDFAVVEPTDAGPVTGGDDVTTDPGPPMAGAHLEYARNPAPAYPREALAGNDEGTVLLEVTVDVDGKPIEVRVARSSGHRALDLAARRQVLSSWLFRPAMRDGRAVQAIGLVPVEFKLN